MLKKKGKKIKSVFAANIVARRKLLGLSQEKLAAKANIGLNTLKHIELDISGGWPGTKEAIAKALNCTVSDLYQEDTSKKQTANIEEFQKLLTLWANASETKRQILIKYLEEDISPKR